MLRPSDYGPVLPISEEQHAKKYRGPGETYYEYACRFSAALADDEAHRRALKALLLRMAYLPAGRSQRAVGTPHRVTAVNCFVSGVIPDDSMGIFDKVREAFLTMRVGGGIGYDFSTLRPKGARIKSLGSNSSGPLSFMHVYDAACKCVMSAGSRRGAMMAVLRCDHPDIEEFISAKHDINPTTGQSRDLKHFNISVACTDAFMRAVQDSGPIDLVFNGESYATVDARAMWAKLMRSTWDYAEPGVLFIDTINRMNNLWYCETISATNPCVAGDTPILTSIGYVPIETAVDTPTRVWNGHEWSTVTPKETGRDQPMVLVSLSDGSSLRCTKAHRFVLATGERVKAADLQPGYKLPKHTWPVINGFERLPNAYAQGFYSGDGWTRAETGGDYIALYGEKKPLLNEFNYLSANEYKIDGGYEGTDTTETKLYLYFGINKFLTKTFVPTSMYTVEDRLEWLSGVTDSDGFVTKDGCIQITSKNRQFLMKVKMMLNTVGASGNVTEMKDCWRINISATHAWNLHKLGLRPRRVAELCEPQREAARFIQVVSIAPSGIEPIVYCFTEEKRHTGIFNGVLTGQCGEQPLPPYGACLLGSFNMVKYVRPRNGSRFIDFAAFEDDIPAIVRATDNIIDRTIYPLPEQKAEQKAKRRMGLGVTGMANALEACGLPYGSEDYISLQSHILKTLRDVAYRTSAQLAAEKGAFPLFDRDKYLDGRFVATLPQDIRDLIAKHGIRNSHLTSIAPTGTISLTADNVSSGIEPVFAYRTERRIIEDGQPAFQEITDYGFREFKVEGRRADDLSPEEHVDVLVAAQRFVDSAVSKTCNVGEHVSWERFKEVYLRAYRGGAKGCTTFRAAGKIYGILNSKDEDKAEGGACFIDTATGQKECG